MTRYEEYFGMKNIVLFWLRWVFIVTIMGLFVFGAFHVFEIVDWRNLLGQYYDAVGLMMLFPLSLFGILFAGLVGAATVLVFTIPFVVMFILCMLVYKIFGLVP